MMKESKLLQKRLLLIKINSSPDICNKLHKLKTNVYSTERINGKGMSKTLESIKLKCGEVTNVKILLI